MIEKSHNATTFILSCGFTYEK